MVALQTVAEAAAVVSAAAELAGVASLFIGLRNQRVTQAIDCAALVKELSGLSDEELRCIVEDNPAVAVLAEHAFREAAATASDEKRRLLAKVVAAAMRGDATAEVEPLGFLLRTLIALDEPHITLLVIIASPREGHGQLAGKMVDGYVRRPEIAARWPSAEDLIDPALSVLLREALIREDDAPWNENTRSVSATDYGRRFLNFLSDTPDRVRRGDLTRA